MTIAGFIVAALCRNDNNQETGEGLFIRPRDEADQLPRWLSPSFIKVARLRVAFSFPMVFERYHDVLRWTKHRFPSDNTSCCFTDGHEPSFIFQLRICRISLHSFGTSQALMQSSLSLFHLINLRRQIIPAIQKNVNSRFFLLFLLVLINSLIFTVY